MEVSRRMYKTKTADNASVSPVLIECIGATDGNVMGPMGNAGLSAAVEKERCLDIDSCLVITCHSIYFCCHGGAPFVTSLDSQAAGLRSIFCAPLFG